MYASTTVGGHHLHGTIHAALDATARFRGVEVAPLSSVADDLVEVREQTYRAYRIALGVWTAPSFRPTSATSSTR